MSDRDRDLTGLFVRDIDRIDLPPRAAWRPAPGREPWIMSALRPLAFVAAAGLVLAAALAAGIALRERGGTAAPPSPAIGPSQAPASSATPGASPAATATAAPSPTASPRAGVLDERFGFVFYESPGNPDAHARVRSETSEAEISSFPIEGLHSAISPDGRSVAYWQPVREGPVLHVRSVAGGAAREVLRGAADEAAGRIVWSPDGKALVVALTSAGPRPAIHATRVSEIWTIDLASGDTEQIATRTDG